MVSERPFSEPCEASEPVSQTMASSPTADSLRIVSELESFLISMPRSEGVSSYRPPSKSYSKCWVSLSSYTRCYCMYVPT
jgi:hypothetical protein